MDAKKRILPIRTAIQGSEPLEGLLVGKVVGAEAKGILLVEFAGSGAGGVPARLTSSASRALRGFPVGREVLLGFQENDAACPIIIDALRSHPADAGQDPGSCDGGVCVGEVEEVHVDRKRLIFEAAEEVVIRCGEACITLTSAGKVVIKGKYLLSRASETNSIKGSSVRIN